MGFFDLFSCQFLLSLFCTGKHALDEETCNNPKIDDLTPEELEAVQQWESSFRQKYFAAGQVVSSQAEKEQKTAEEKKRYDAETARLEQAKQTQPKL